MSGLTGIAPGWHPAGVIAPAPLLSLFLAVATAAGGWVPAAWGQSSLGTGGALPPPRPATPDPAPQTVAPVPPPPRVAKPVAPTAPAQPGAVRPAPKPNQAAPAAAKPRPPAAAVRPRAPVAPGAAGAAAAGAAAAAKPPEPSPPPPPAAPSIGSATGLPLPRFAALGSNQVNMRVGPDTRFPVEWTYQRRDLPVQIIDEHQNWRRIRDPDGTEGWVQRPLLNSRRTFVARGEEPALRRRPEADAVVVARLQPGVVGRLRRCEASADWCEAQVGDYRGWLRRGELWGVAAGEAVE